MQKEQQTAYSRNRNSGDKHKLNKKEYNPEDDEHDDN